MPLPLIQAVLGLANFAPSLLRFFGAGEKSAAVAEKVAGIAQAITGTSEPDAALAAIEKDPALALEFKKAVLAADTDLEKAFLADRHSARERDVEVRKLTGGQNVRADIMLIAAFVAVISIAAFVTWISLSGLEGKAGLAIGFLTTIGGMFARNIGSAFDFEFGSSRGSKDKDAALVKWVDES
jgi:hypothetical protein